MGNKKHKISITSSNGHELNMETEFAIVVLHTENGFTFSKLGANNLADDAFYTIIAAEATKVGLDGIIDQPHIKPFIDNKLGKEFLKAVRKSSTRKGISFDELKSMSEEPFEEFNS